MLAGREVQEGEFERGGALEGVGKGEVGTRGAGAGVGPHVGMTLAASLESVF